MKPNQSKKPYKGQVHTPKSQKGLGDFYGTGIRAPIGKMREDSMGMQSISHEKLRIPPKSVV